MDKNILAEPQIKSPPVSLTQLIISLEIATDMAKQLPTTRSPAHLLQITTSLHQSHHHLSCFLSHTQFADQLLLSPPAAAENTLSSATGAAVEDEPLQIGDDDDDEEDGKVEEDFSKAMIDNVGERMRVCFIKRKRAKRPLSPAAAASVGERMLLGGDGDREGVIGLDPHGTKLRVLELVYQFHG